MINDLSYHQLEQRMQRGDIPISTAQAHGSMTGLFCIDPSVNYRFWFENLFEGGESGRSLEDDCVDLLSALFDSTLSDVYSDDFCFELFLPDDDLPLSDRAIALSEWCEGFLYGLGYKAGKREWPGDCSELLRDIVEISRLDPAAEGETDEAALSELTEYIRMGVYLIRMELVSSDRKA